MRALLIWAMFVLATIEARSQTRKTKDCDGFWQAAMSSLSVAKQGKEPDYPHVIRQLNAYKACDPDVSKIVDAKIVDVNNAILQLRDKAVDAQIQAEKEAIKSNFNYWIADSRQLLPIDGLNLLFTIYKYYPTSEVLTSTITNLFNNSYWFNFSQMATIKGEFSDMLSFGHYLFLKSFSNNTNYEVLLNVNTGVESRYFNGEHLKHLQIAVSNNKKWLLIINKNKQGYLHILENNIIRYHSYLGLLKSAWFSDNDNVLIVKRGELKLDCYPLDVNGKFRSLDNVIYSDEKWAVIKDSLFNVFDLKKGEVVKSEYGTDFRWITSSSNKKWVVYLKDNSLTIWDTFKDSISIVNTTLNINNIKKISNDGRYLYFGVSLYDLSHCLDTQAGTNFDFSEWLTPYKIYCSKDGRWLRLMYDEQNSSKVYCKVIQVGKWNEPSFLLKSDISSVQFSDDGKWIATSDIKNKSIKIWNIEKESLYREVELTNVLQYASPISTHSSFITAASKATHSQQLYSFQTGKAITPFKNKYDFSYTASTDEDWIGEYYNDNTILYNNNLLSKNVYSFINNTYPIDSAKCLNSDWLITAYNIIPMKYQLWNYKTGEIFKLNGKQIEISDLKFSPDNKWVYLEVFDEQSDSLSNVVFNLFTKKYISLYKKGFYSINSPTFSNDNKTFSYNAESVGENISFKWDLEKIILIDSIEQSVATTSSKPPENVYKLFTTNYRCYLPSYIIKRNEVKYSLESYDKKYNIVAYNHYLAIYQISLKKQIATYWVNKQITSINCDEKYTYIVSGKSVHRFELDKTGDFTCWGDEEPADYTFNEIIMWNNVFKKFNLNGNRYTYLKKYQFNKWLKLADRYKSIN